jgi:effector-binding domain-containing protein
MADIEMITVEPRALAVARFDVATDELDAMGERMGAAFGAVMAHLRRAGIVPRGPAVARYEPTTDGFTVAAGFPVDAPVEPGDGIDSIVLPAGEVAHTTHLGPYDQLPKTYEALRAGVEAQGRSLVDGAAMWEEYWSGPDAPSEDARTEVFWPVAPR